MFTKLTPAEGVVIISAFGITMILLSLIVSRKRIQDREEFLLAKRKVNIIPGAMAIASSWIWAPALFLSAQKSYENGIAGTFWIIVPNILSLIFFAYFAGQLRRFLPKGYTLPQYIRERHGSGSHIVYVIQFLILQLGSLTIQSLAGAKVLQVCSDIPVKWGAFLIVGFALLYAIIGGLRTSVITDYIQMAVILIVCAALVPGLISATGGIPTILKGLGGIKGNGYNPLDEDVFLTFGLAICISLLAAPLGDQMQWQRAYALKENRIIWPCYTLGALIYACVPLALSTLGFVAASPEISKVLSVTDNQMIGPLVASTYLPHYMVYGVVFIFLAALCSTADSSLLAIASLAASDCFPFKRSSCSFGSTVICHSSESPAKEAEYITFSRVAMVLAAAAAYGISQIPGIELMHVMLGYGAIRAATMIPTIITLCDEKATIHNLASILAMAMTVAFILRLIGDLNKMPWVSTIGTISAVLISSLTLFNIRTRL